MVGALEDELSRSRQGSHAWASMVTFGPGDGKKDIDLLKCVKEAFGAPPMYFAVDMSTTMLQMAVTEISQAADLPLGCPRVSMDT